MKKQRLRKKQIAAALLPVLAITLLAGCGAAGGENASADGEKKNGYRDAVFTLETEETEGRLVTFNGMTFEVPAEWRTEEETESDALYYPTQEDTDTVRVHAGAADHEYDKQQELVNDTYAELMKERIDAGCYIESYDINVAGHRGKWFRSDVNYIADGGKPIEGYEVDESMAGYVRECVLYAADKQNYVLLEATYPMGSETEKVFEPFYKSPHYHR